VYGVITDETKQNNIKIENNIYLSYISYYIVFKMRVVSELMRKGESEHD